MTLRSTALVFGMLVCCVTHVHAQFGGGGLGGGAAPSAGSVGGSEVTAPSAALIAALAEPIDIDMNDVPLFGVAEFLSEKLNVPVLLDEMELDNNGIANDQALTFHLAGVPAHQCLELLLKRYELGYVCRGDILEITTADAALYSYYVQMYDVSDLIGPATADPLDGDELIGLLEEGLPEAEWRDIDGDGGSLRQAGDVLVVTQNRRVQTAVSNYLTQLRAARTVAMESVPVQEMPVVAYRVASMPEMSQATAEEPANPDPLPEKLVTIISTSIAADSWPRTQEVGSPAVWAVPGAVVVRHSPEVQAQVRKFLKPFEPATSANWGHLPYSPGGYGGGLGGLGGLGGVPAGGGGGYFSTAPQ